MGKNGKLIGTAGNVGAKIYEHSVLPAPQTLAGQRKGLSNIESYEDLEAKDFVDRQFIKLTGKPFQFKTAGYYVAVKIHVRDEEIKVVEREDGTRQTIWMPPQYLEGDKFNSCSALVCGIGPFAYDKERFPQGPWAKVGDFVAIPRQSCFLMNYRGVAIGLLPDDQLLGVIDDPADITNINQKPLI